MKLEIGCWMAVLAVVLMYSWYGLGMVVLGLLYFSRLNKFGGGISGIVDVAAGGVGVAGGCVVMLM